MRTRYVSDTARANWSSLIAGIVGVGAVFWFFAVNGGLANIDSGALAINIYLVTWPLFGALYLVWTHVAYSRRGPRALGASVRREKVSQGRGWIWLFGYGGASSWTMAAAFVAVFVTIVIAQDATYRSNAIYIILALLCVACSWALMIYAFALQYLRLNGGEDLAKRDIELTIEDDPQFGDYLTFTVLLSTMAATLSAQIRTRRAWLMVRTNVLFAFVFNSVIVAMVVSLLLAGLLD